MTQTLQFVTDLDVVVDLAVEHESMTTSCHVLVRASADVDDGQAPVPERDGAGLVDTVAVRSPVRQEPRHCADGSSVSAHVRVNPTGDPAHLDHSNSC